MGESVDPDTKFRIVAEGIAEANACLIFGCLMGAVGCGAASVALLGSMHCHQRLGAIRCYKNS